jgi:pyridoxal phosphate enzyme (YggS family)
VIAARVSAVRDRIARAAARAGRQAEEVQLLAVSKTHPQEALREAFAAGVRDFGENRVQEAEDKIAALEDLRVQGMRWHLVGHLQTNKVRKAVPLFDKIHSVDSTDLAQRMDRIGTEEKCVVHALVEVDLAGETTKNGVREAELMRTLEAMRGLASVRLEGLMCIPPFDEDPERTRGFFRKLRELKDRAVAAGLLQGGELSMGMSHDFDVAVEEGATLVRVGTAVFGERRTP